MPKCFYCAQELVGLREGARFCRGTACKDNWHNRERKNKTFILPAKLNAQLYDLAQSQDIPALEMLCRILNQSMNPDGRPVEDSELYDLPAGQSQGVK